MVTQEEMTEEAVNAAWNMFQRMPSSNPSDFAHAAVRALMPLVKRAQAEALREAADDVPYYPAILEKWLRDRAARIEQGETA